MKPSVWTQYFGDLTPEQALTELTEEGFYAAELSDEHSAALFGRGDPEKVGAAFGAYARELGMDLPQGHLILQCDICGPDARRTLDTLKGWLAMYQAIGIQNAVLHVGAYDTTASPAQILDMRVSALTELTGFLRGSEMAICLENIGTCPQAEDLMALIDAVDSPNLAVCLDTGHLHIAHGNQRAFILRVGKHLRALHIADNQGETDQHMAPYGRGDIPWPEVMAALREVGYNGLFNLEIPGENSAPLPVRRAKLRYIRQLCAYMLAEL
ncbi:MAG: sugar phosphate isomerase/epimerase family protein [Christensenellales bacterium]|jgi:sugar phosphate isomerase/epimerase